MGCIDWAHIHWRHLLSAWHFTCNTIEHWMVGEEVMKGEMAPLGIVEVGNVDIWVQLGLEGLASTRNMYN